MQLFSLIIFLCLTLTLSGQGFQTTEELQVEKLYIEATSKRILGAFGEAADLYEQVLRMDPDNHAAAYELSRVYDALGRRNDAMTSIETAIRLHDDNPWYFVMKADIQEKQENYAAAAETYAYLIEHFPDQKYYYEHLVDLYKRTGQTRKALDVLEKNEQHTGITEDVIREQFDLYNQIGDTEKAMQALLRLLRTYPHNTDYLHLIATYCIQLGRNDEAKDYYKKILELNTEDARARLALARDFKASGQDVDYLESISDIIGNPSIQLDAKIQELIPFTERLTSEPDSQLNAALLRLTDQLMEAHPGEAKVHALRGDLYSLAGDLAAARKAYERTLQLDNSVYSVWEQLLYILADQHDSDALINTAEKALDVFPNQATVYYLGGLGHFEKKNFSDAVSMLEHALIMTSRHPALRIKVHTLLGNVYFESGQPEKAIQVFEKALNMEPDAFLVLQEYSYALARSGKDYKKAYTLAERANAIQEGSGKIQHILAQSALGQKNFILARQHAEKAIPLGFDKDADHMELYGDILYSLGETDDAVQAWQASLDLDSDNKRIQKKIEERKIIH